MRWKLWVVIPEQNQEWRKRPAEATNTSGIVSTDTVPILDPVEFYAELMSILPVNHLLSPNTLFQITLPQ